MNDLTSYSIYHDKNKAINVTNFYYNHIMNLALNRFTYKNLPVGLTTKIIEEQLILHGLVAFFQEDGIYKCLRAFGTGNRNIYNYATEYNVYGLGYHKVKDISDIILIPNNPTWTPENEMILYYASNINDIEQTKAVNLAVNNMPFIITGDKTTELTAKNIWSQIKNKFFVMFVNKNTLEENSINVMTTGVEMLQAEFQDTKNSVLNEVLTFLGINNTPTDKKERLIVDEVNSNNEYIQTNIDLMYKERKNAVKLINEKYNLEIEVYKTSEYMEENEEVKEVGVDNE